MNSWRIDDLAQACGGEVFAGSGAVQVRRVWTDSRTVQPGDLFIALSGERFDGHGFLPDAVARGAAAVLVASSQVERVAGITAGAVIRVADTRRALGQLGAWHRRRWGARVVVVSGSNGKTTTKNLIASVLRQRGRTVASPASYNNEIGVPLTLLSCTSDDGAAVVEVGTNHPGELAPLVAMSGPDWGVLTGIGSEHLEFFGDLAGVAQEEGTLAELLPASGRFFGNADTPEWASIVRRSVAPVISVGCAAGSDWRVREIAPDADGVTFQIEAVRSEFSGAYRVRLLGRHQATNAALAVAVGAEAGLSRSEIACGLAACPPAAMRLQLLRVDGVEWLNDAYNANSDSVRAALATVRDLPCRGRKAAVLGDMAELGAWAESEHAQVGREAARAGLDQLFFVGRMAEVMARAARTEGFAAVDVSADAEVARTRLQAWVHAGDLVLIKASRAARLERLLPAESGRGDGAQA